MRFSKKELKDMRRKKLIKYFRLLEAEVAHMSDELDESDRIREDLEEDLNKVNGELEDAELQLVQNEEKYNDKMSKLSERISNLEYDLALHARTSYGGTA